MEQMVEQKALHCPNLTAVEVAKAVMTETEEKYSDRPFQFLTLNQMRPMVYRFRYREHGEWESIIISFPTAFCSEIDPRLFLQFNMTVNVDNELQKIIGWGHPDLIDKAKYRGVNLFVDCTFKIVPHGFSQCMVLMAFDQPSQLYIPFMYILLQSKKFEAYWHAIHAAIVATNSPKLSQRESLLFVTKCKKTQ